MTRRVLGVIGHVDHGKTALVRALTGTETDRLPEERRRGVSIALGFAHATIGGQEIDFVDMPGHERFVRTMVSGATGVDAVLLVVSAAEGIKPQTVEHAEVAALLGVGRAVVAVTKADLVAPEAAAAVGDEALRLLAARGIAAAGAPVAVSALTGAGLGALRDALAHACAQAPPAEDDGFAYLPLDRAFSAPGFGVVATGALRRGALTLDGDYALAPSGAPVRLRGLQQHGEAVTRAQPGARLAVNLRGVEREAAGRGAALAPAGLLAAARWWTVSLTAAASAPELKGGARLVLLHGTAEVEARVRLLDRDVLAPGETALAQLHASEPVAAPARARFVLRTASPPATVAGGRVVDPDAHRLRRRDPAVLEALSRLAEADAPGVVRLALQAAGAAGAPALRLARLAGVSLARAGALAAPLAVELRGGLWVARPAFEAAGARLLAALEQVEDAHPNGVPHRRLAALLPGVEPAVVEALVARLAAAGQVGVAGGGVRRLRAAREAVRARTEAELRDRVAEAVRRGGLSPAEPEGPPRELRQTVDALVRDGVLVRTYDRVQKREIVFHREAVEQARRVLAPLLAGEGLLAREAGAALGVSRKFSIPLLEHLDAIQFTRREGDRRVLGRAARA